MYKDKHLIALYYVFCVTKIFLCYDLLTPEFILFFIPIITKEPFNIEKSYIDPVNQRKEIREDNNGKIGVYAWVNNINNKVYVGSGDPLYIRLSDYYQEWFLNSRTSLYIVRALNKYTMYNFSLHILEYTSSDNLIECEQKWIDLIKPEYNINPIAGNSKGYKHTAESIEKMRELALGRTHTEEVKRVMSESRKKENNPFFGKKHTPEVIMKLKEFANNRVDLPVPGLEVEITNIETKVTTVYTSIRKAAIAINSNIKTILRREKTLIEKGINTPYRKKYIINIKRN